MSRKMLVLTVLVVFVGSALIGASIWSALQPPKGFRQQIDGEIRKALPLFNYISQEPYHENWMAFYTGYRELTVQMRQDTPEIRQEVIDWMVSHGGKPSQHKIIWTVGYLGTPTPAPNYWLMTEAPRLTRMASETATAEAHP